MKLATFFAGAGGLDLGFRLAGFDCIWANEYDKEIWETYEKNHPNTVLDKRSLTKVQSNEVPDCDGIIGGPPCQSWSEAGALRGIKDTRGQLFYDFMRILADKQPNFFLAENVSGMLLPIHKQALENIKNMFKECGYTLSFQLLNAADYGVPQDRKRVFFIGYRSDLGIEFDFNKLKPTKERKTLFDTIHDIKDSALPSIKNNYTNGDNCIIPNHEYMTGGFSTIFMSRNRVRKWDEVSFTIQAGARHAPIHPQAPVMQLIGKDKRIFVPGQENLYRRLSVREIARIQTFPDDFIFYYKGIAAGYKMIGNAVPVDLAKIIATQIKKDLENIKTKEVNTEINWQSVSNKLQHFETEVN
ncbi:DNA cytosine methyltransferase [Flavobacterium sp.]